MPPTLANRAPEVFRTAHVSRRATTGWIVESEDGLAYTGGLLALTDLPPILRARRRRAANGRIRWLLSNVPACFRARRAREFRAGAGLPDERVPQIPCQRWRHSVALELRWGAAFRHAYSSLKHHSRAWREISRFRFFRRPIVA